MPRENWEKLVLWISHDWRMPGLHSPGTHGVPWPRSPGLRRQWSSNLSKWGLRGGHKIPPRANLTPPPSNSKLLSVVPSSFCQPSRRDYKVGQPRFWNGASELLSGYQPFSPAPSTIQKRHLQSGICYVVLGLAALRRQCGAKNTMHISKTYSLKGLYYRISRAWTYAYGYTHVDR